jgi:hypothetical protein
MLSGLDAANRSQKIKLRFPIQIDIKLPNEVYVLGHGWEHVFKVIGSD